MHIENVQDVLAGHNPAEPLHALPLGVLDPRREPYHALLCQPHGTIEADDGRIGNADPAACIPMYTALLGEAAARHCQLAVTPEYSTPWQAVEAIARGDYRPPTGSLWALGCESIAPAALEALAASLADRPDVRLIHEALNPQERAQKRFIDPLVYVFWTRTDAGIEKLCLLVQFKTMPSRDDDNLELRHLYLGDAVYRFTNAAPSINLIGIICSDAFGFTPELTPDVFADTLFIHIQLNKNPGNPVYAGYRSHLYATASEHHVEVLCLNWASRLGVAGAQEKWNEISGSGWYVYPRGVSVNDADVNRLHRDGVYYSLVDKRWHSFYLNYSAHFILIEKQRVYATGPQVLAPRIAPHVVVRRIWNSADGAWEDSRADDGFAAFLQAYEPISAQLSTLGATDALAVERALELLQGPPGKPSTWYALSELQAFKVADEESLRRITVSQETNPQRVGVVFRRNRVRAAVAAIRVIGQPLRWPPGATDLAQGFRYRWNAADPHCNVEPLNGGGKPATLVYLGEEPTEDELLNTYDKLGKALRVYAAGYGNNAMYQDPIRAIDRLCVVYRRNNALESFSPSGHHSITDPGTNPEDDITRSA